MKLSLIATAAALVAAVASATKIANQSTNYAVADSHAASEGTCTKYKKVCTKATDPSSPQACYFKCVQTIKK